MSQDTNPSSAEAKTTRSSGIPCPGCRRPIRLPATRLKPGTFRARCGGCHEPFLITITRNDVGKLKAKIKADPMQRLPDNTSMSPEMHSALGLNGGGGE